MVSVSQTKRERKINSLKKELAATKKNKTAFILASTTNPKEYIQRRGRVLRKSPETGKEYAEIYDFITLPRPLEDVSSLTAEEAKRDLSLVKKELSRIKNK